MADTTRVTLPAGPEVLTFDAEYLVSLLGPAGGEAFYGTLLRRERNGDLVFALDDTADHSHIEAVEWAVGESAAIPLCGTCGLVLESAGDALIVPRETRRIATKRLSTVEAYPGTRPAPATETEERPIGALLISQRQDGEAAPAFLARLEREYPHNYPAFVETDQGQDLLREAAKAARSAAREAKRHRPLDSFTPDERNRIRAAVDAHVLTLARSGARARFTATVDQVADAILAEERALSGGTFNEGVAADLRAYAAEIVTERRASLEATRPPAEARVGRYAAGVKATRVVLDGKTVSEKAAPPPEVPEEVIARRERENGRNRIWRCATCRRRTRQAVCANGHDPVSAPDGKRRDERETAL